MGASTHDIEDVEMEGEYSDQTADSDGGDRIVEITSHGTYLDRVHDDLEELEEYQEGGHHPVHLGEILGSRYRVIHKLGRGSSGIVWLCRDTHENSYVAAKVFLANMAPGNLADLGLALLGSTAPGARYLAIPLDHFLLQRLNGTHQCIVLPVLGPCVAPKLWLRMEDDPGPFLRKLAYQAAQTTGLLHKHGICHGDFRPSDILLKLTNLGHLTEEQIFSIIGPPVIVNVHTTSGDPTYHSWGNEYLTDQICVINFGEAYPLSSPPPELNIPEYHLPPEVLLKEPNSIGPACDLWALGYTLFEIRQQTSLFDMVFDEDELLAEIVRLFGRLPERWWRKWEARGDFFDEEGRWLGDSDEVEIKDGSLVAAISRPTEVIQAGEGDDEQRQRTLVLPAEEQRLMADLLRKLFRYEPGERIEVEEVLGS